MSARDLPLDHGSWRDVDDAVLLLRAAQQAQHADDALGKLLAQAPRLFLLDEPLNHLDLHHQIAALELFQRLLREQGTARGSVLVLHDINLAARYADHIILLDGRGGVIAGDRDAVLRADLLGQAFGHPLRRIEHEGRVVFLPD